MQYYKLINSVNCSKWIKYKVMTNYGTVVPYIQFIGTISKDQKTSFMFVSFKCH